MSFLLYILSHREGPLPARSKLDELLGRGTAAKLLTRPGTGERREFKLDKKYQKPEGEAAQRMGREESVATSYEVTALSLSGPLAPWVLSLFSFVLFCFVKIGSPWLAWNYLDQAGPELIRICLSLLSQVLGLKT